MNYQVIIQPTAFQEIETAYRWMCDNLSPEVANNWYYELEDAIASLQKFPNRCMIASEAKVIGGEVRQLWIGKQRKYRVLFVVEEDVIAILHVRHSRQSYLSEES
ncbi:MULTISPECIES: type II toxin-antitoxin system RelE/ParE family toxin [Aphanizomenonaceae]|jgi:plasmid stabilization system protein ParE|uniref:Type II toxin-antitoxin system RelE/ParE family toxin n=1 Tax=Dolichospermum heterosporum TAC447 TaxID=747523 RepID=A0ABY5LTG6_9CYAN|nr:MULTISPECIES: type II toxin-antitoxin system RelE/ParE family toxin [Aphanizomenonaceae]MBE9259558.1 type II toxin-antitoxin system RelE/ParE family toxin [Dolichospermum sp. LEGE 00246]UUO15293.1 type II toxin-antitoxin system RelE/ParE family toxin [Dolichospermum heterosporum TAC447]